MRIIMLAVVAALTGWTLPAGAQGTPEADRSIRDMLPLFEKNRCAEIKDPVAQLFCGDPELQSTGIQLNAAVQERVSRIADRQMAIEENVEWIRGRSRSCGIFQPQSVATSRIPAVKTCLLKETKERIAILEDPNFDCLADDSTAGNLICSDPELTLADKDLNSHVLALIAKMTEREVPPTLVRVTMMLVIALAVLVTAITASKSRGTGRMMVLESRGGKTVWSGVWLTERLEGSTRPNEM